MSYEPVSGGDGSAESPGSAEAGHESRATADLKSAAYGIGRTAAERAERLRTSAAGGLESVASALHRQGQRVAGAADSAADTAAAGAHYLRQHDVRTIRNDVMRVVRRHPGTALLGAAILGFLAGRSLSRS
jgi:hypothetical protein